MPLSHLTLTVSHLPTSTSFFLSCLQPLGYRFIGRHDNSVGFGSEPGEPADFWISEERPGVPATAAHVAFPAPSREAVNSFFIAALKAGGKIHGEPCLRDTEQNYYSAAVIDFDGNSIEAVHRPSYSRNKSRSSDKSLTAIENGSVVSKASSVKSRSVATREPSPPSEVGSVAKSTVSHRSRHTTGLEDRPRPTINPAPPATQLQVPPKENNLTGAKAVVSTLIGAAAGAAIAYAVCKGDVQSEVPPPKYSEASPTSSLANQAMPEQYRAIEAAPMSDYARSALSKNPKASSIFEGLETASKILGTAAQSLRGGAAGEEPQYQEPRRHSTTGSIVYSAGSEMNLPIRAIEGVSPDDMSEYHRMYPCSPSTFISSFVDKPRRRESDGASVYSSSTIKPSRRPSSRHSQSAQSVATVSEIGSYHSRKSNGATPTPSIYSATHTARNIPLPPSVAGTESVASSSRSSRRHSVSHSIAPSSHSRRDRDRDRDDYAATVISASQQSIKSYRSAHDVPLPASVVDGGSTVYFDDVDFNPPARDNDDSQSRASRRTSRSKATAAHSHANSQHSRRRSQSRSSTGRSRRSSKFDEPILPSDSISQVSTNVSRKSRR
ncbi:hypothetical protein VTO42DRAFT_2268 [Malbranchea cinnamomea]